MRDNPNHVLYPFENGSILKENNLLHLEAIFFLSE